MQLLLVLPITFLVVFATRDAAGWRPGRPGAGDGNPGGPTGRDWKPERPAKPARPEGCGEKPDGDYGSEGCRETPFKGQPGPTRFGWPSSQGEYWPWAMMEFTEFAGRCATAYAFITMVDIPFPEKGVLGEGCPFVFKVAKWLFSATREQRLKAEEQFEKIFHTFQCGNLMGEAESLYFFSNFTLGPDMTSSFAYDSHDFIVAAAPMFKWCKMLFENVHEQMMTFTEELNAIMAFIEDKDEGEDEREDYTQLAETLRELMLTDLNLADKQVAFPHGNRLRRK